MPTLDVIMFYNKSEFAIQEIKMFVSKLLWSIEFWEAAWDNTNSTNIKILVELISDSGWLQY